MKKSKFTDSQIMDALKRAEAGEAVLMLAENWPQDYPEGAVEWLMVRDGGRRLGC